MMGHGWGAEMDQLYRKGRGTVEGIKFKVLPGEIEEGDLYLAERNTGPKLLTAKMNDHDLQCIFPKEAGYPYDTWECIKVAFDEE